MNKQEQIASLLARFMAAETTEQEERQLAEYFRTATDIPTEWQPYADMFRIFDDGATRLSNGELEACATAPTPRRKTWRVGRVAASLAAILCLGAVAATITYRALVEPETQAEVSETSEVSERCELPKAPASEEVPCLPDTITFNNISLADIARQIAAIYGCQVVIADRETAELRLYFTLPKGSTAADFATIIDDYEALAATIKDDTITIKKQEAAR